MPSVRSKRGPVQDGHEGIHRVCERSARDTAVRGLGQMIEQAGAEFCSCVFRHVSDDLALQPYSAGCSTPKNHRSRHKRSRCGSHALSSFQARPFSTALAWQPAASRLVSWSVAPSSPGPLPRPLARERSSICSWGGRPCRGHVRDDRRTPRSRPCDVLPPRHLTWCHGPPHRDGLESGLHRLWIT